MDRSSSSSSKSRRNIHKDSCMLPRNLAWKSSYKVLNYLEGRFYLACQCFWIQYYTSVLSSAGTPLILESAYKITQLISLIDHGRICEGNSDSKFWRLRNDVMAFSRIIVVRLMLHLWLIIPFNSSLNRNKGSCIH